MSMPIQAVPAARRLLELETELIRVTAERDRLARELRQSRDRERTEGDRPPLDRHAL
jgi:hypothetical protein